MKTLAIFLVAAISLLTSGCTLNSVKSLPKGDVAAENRAVIIYGVKVEGAWKYPALTIQMAEYDSGKQAMTGNCLVFNRAEATVPSAPGEVKYFAFDVRPGHYVYSPFNGAQLKGDFYAFAAPPGKSVYIGDFVYEKNQIVSLTRNLDDARYAIKTALPELGGEISLAKTAIAKPPTLFMCTP